MGAAAWRALDAAIMPQRCAFCGLPSESPVCAGCHDDLPWLAECCPICALALPPGTPAGTLCADCQARPPPFDAAWAPLAYAFPVDAAIAALKFQRKRFYLPALAGVLADATGRLPPGIDAVLPVPLHRWRRARRGFNQSRELSRPVAAKLGVPLVDNVRRVAATPYQSGSSAAERRRNVRAAFRVVGKIEHRHVLIVDDVITTGSTCSELAKTLKRRGAATVSVLALARA